MIRPVSVRRFRWPAAAVGASRARNLPASTSRPQTSKLLASPTLSDAHEKHVTSRCKRTQRLKAVRRDGSVAETRVSLRDESSGADRCGYTDGNAFFSITENNNNNNF